MESQVGTTTVKFTTGKNSQTDYSKKTTSKKKSGSSSVAQQTKRFHSQYKRI